MPLIPTGKRILIKKIDKNNSRGNLLLITEDRNAPFEGEVIAIGSKSDLEIKVGDIVLVPPYSHIPVPNEENMMLVDDALIIGVMG
jgi:co-chaperonin GroES (HSP10)